MLFSTIWEVEINSRVSLSVSVETPVELFTRYPGERLHLSCPDQDPAHTVNWTKDHAAVSDGEHTRIRDGQLEIESVELSDSGLYSCTTFGNHSVLFNVTSKRTQRRLAVFTSWLLYFHVSDW